MGYVCRYGIGDVASEKLFILEEERDFFREQVMQLNLQVGQLTKREEKLKIQLEERTAQTRDYQAVAQSIHPPM